MSAKLRSVPAGRRMPVVTRKVELTDEYEGWWIVIRANAPAGILLRLQGLEDTEAAMLDNLAHMLDFIAGVTVDWNFVDEEGAPLPLGRASCDCLPPELVKACMDSFREAMSAPKVSPVS